MNSQSANPMDHVSALIGDPLSAARDAARAGSRVIGYYGNDIPVALILAAGALPVRLRAAPRSQTPRADLYLESAHSPELRALVEQWLAGELEFIETVIFPRSDDSAQRVYYYLCELQRRGACAGPRPLLYDVAGIGRPVSVDYTRESTRRLARDLGANQDQLPQALRRVADREKLASDIRARCAANPPLPGSLAWAVARAGGSDWRVTFDDLARRWLGAAISLPGARRIVLAGDLLPDASLHEAIESAGGSVVLELTESAADEHPASPPLLDALADQFHARRTPVRAMREDAHWAVSNARSGRADAVIFWLAEEDESLPWEIARQMRNLATAGIPALALTRQPWKPDHTALQRVSEFVAGRENQP